MNKYIQTYNTTAEYEAGTKENPNVSFVVDTNKIYYNGEEHQLPIPPSKQYLTFKAIDDCTFGYRSSRVIDRLQSIDYSIDSGNTWVTISRDTNTPTIYAGNTILLRANRWNPNLSYYSYYPYFFSTGRFEVMGNIMSLVSGDSFSEATTITTNGQFYGLFSGCTGLTSAENLVLPTTTLAQSCYGYMFQGCTSLTKAPSVLPATTLVGGCYSNMFNGCTSLITAPTLPATTLYNSCYGSMFAGCTSLTTAPILPATTLAQRCYENMFYGCTSLTTAPELPATTLVGNCYNQMFYGCTSLNSVTCLATDISASFCTTNWVNGVSSTGTFTKAASMTSWSTGNSGIPTGWTVVDA